MEERQKVFIRGIKDRGEEVIQKLVDLGGENVLKLKGHDEDLLYFIDLEGKLSNVLAESHNTEGVAEIFLDNPEVPESINGEVEASNIATAQDKSETFAETKESDDDFFSSFIKFIKETPDEELFKEWNKHSDLDKSDVKIVDFIKALQERELEWEDFGEVEGWFTDAFGDIKPIVACDPSKYNKSVMPTKSLAEATLALCQLLQWRNKMWKEDNCEPNFNDRSIAKHSIIVIDGEPLVFMPYGHHRVLSFGNKDSADRFLKLHKTLIKQAGELL